MSGKGTILGHLSPINHDANEIDFDNIATGLLSTDAQAAIDEVYGPRATYLTDANTKAWWKLDALSGVDQFLDSSVNANDLTWGGPAFGGTVVGSLYYKGFYFHNPGWPSVNVLWRPISTSVSLQITTNLTADVIFKSEVNQNSSALISCMNDSESVGWEVFDRVTTINFSVRTTVGIYRLSVAKAAFYGLNEWVHLRATYDGAFIRLYSLNYTRLENSFTLVGSLAATGTIKYNTATYNMFCIGARWFGSYGDLFSGHDHFEGIIDQVAISNVIRTTTFGYQDIRPMNNDAVNLGNRLRKFDTVYATRLIGAIENFDVARTVFVSSGFVEDTATRRFQTLTAALAYVTTQTPAIASPWLIHAYSGVYAENVTMLPYTALQMPMGQITGTVTVVGNSLVNVDKIVSGAANGVQMLAAETATAYVWANYIQTTTATAVLNQSATTGILIANIRQIDIFSSGLGIGDFISNGHMHVQIGDIYLWGNNSTGVISGGGTKPITGSIDHILVAGAPVSPRGIVVLSGGEVDVNIRELLVPTGEAYHVYVGGILNMFVNEKSGTETNTGVAHVTDASHGSTTGNAHGTNFIQLTDCPITYVSQAGRAPIVNAALNALAFQDVFAPTKTLFVSPQFTNDGARKYTTIQAAINAAVAGDLILVYPGTYNESLTLKPSTTLMGVDKRQVTIAQNNTGNPCLKYTTTVVNHEVVIVQNIMIQGTGNSLVFDIATGPRNGEIYFYDVLFETRKTSYGTWDALCYMHFRNCGFNINNTGGSTLCWKSKVAAASADFTFCELRGDMWNQAPTGIYMTDCTFGSIYATAGTLIFLRCSAGTDVPDPAPYDNFIHLKGGNLSATDCSFGADGDFYPIRAETNTGISLTRCMVQGIDGYHEIHGDIPLTNVYLDSCSFATGLPANVTHQNPVKNIGGGYNFYETLQGALNGVNGNNQRIVLNSDQIITAALTPPSYSILIDGNIQYKITRSAGNPLMTLDTNDNVKFINIDLVGSIDITGNGAQLFLADHTFLTGMVDVQAGDANTLIKLDQCKILGDATDKYCIRIADADPTIIVKRSYLKGSTNPAIYWDGGITNNNLKLAYSSIIHGSVGANVPFGRNAAQTPTVASHHDAFNADPFAATWTNSIGTPYDVSDVDADY